MKAKFVKVKSKLPIFYNPENHGLHVLYERKKDTVIVGDCSKFYEDAYTCIIRYEIPKRIIKSWKRLNKKKLLSYDFLTTKKLMSDELHLCMSDKNDRDEFKRTDFCLSYKPRFIVSKTYKRQYEIYNF